MNIFTSCAVLVSASLILHGGLHPGTFSRGVYFFAFYLSGCVSRSVQSRTMPLHDCLGV